MRHSFGAVHRFAFTLALLGLLSHDAIADDERADPAFYRGRTSSGSAIDALAWVPRVAFFPVHVLAEFGLRRPIYGFAAWADHAHVWPLVMRVLKPDEHFEWSPLLRLDFNVDFAAGATMKVHDAFVRRHDIETSVAFGPYTLEIQAKDRWEVGPTFAGLRGGSSDRQRAFHGFGPYSSGIRRNFGARRLEGFAFVGTKIGPHVEIEAAEGLRRDEVRDGRVQPLSTDVDLGALPGFRDTTLAIASLDARIDSRMHRDEQGGFRMRANGTMARDVRAHDTQFATVELDVEAAVEVSKPDRVLALRFYGMDTFRMGRDPIPITHLAMLGGDRHPGFYWGRFRGESALMTELRYRYPVAYFGDIQLAWSVGNVFAHDFSDFSFGALTSSVSAGVRTRKTGTLPFEVMIGVGTTRFDQSFNVENVRLYLGTTDAL